MTPEYATLFARMAASVGLLMAGVVVGFGTVLAAFKGARWLATATMRYVRERV